MAATPPTAPTMEQQIAEAVRLVVREEIRAALASREAPMLTIPEAAEVAGVSPATIRRRIRAGEIVPVRLGARSVRIRRDSVTRPGGAAEEAAHAVRFPRPASTG